jgi:hypothetical protein
MENTSPMLADAGNLWPKPPFGKSAGSKKTKCQSGNLRRTNSSEMKKYTRLRDEIKGRIRAINDNSSQENPRVTY